MKPVVGPHARARERSAFRTRSCIYGISIDLICSGCIPLAVPAENNPRRPEALPGPRLPVPLLLTPCAWLCVLAVGLGLGAGSATAMAPDASPTAEGLRAVCEGELAAAADTEARRGRQGGGWCAGYLSGVADTLAVLGADGHPAGICGVRCDARALVEAFVLWARMSPRDEHRVPSMPAGAQAALRARWPCG